MLEPTNVIHLFGFRSKDTNHPGHVDEHDPNLLSHEEAEDLGMEDDDGNWD